MASSKFKYGFSQIVEEFHDRTFLIDKNNDKYFSYHDFGSLIERTAFHFVNLLPPGPICCLLDNSIEAQVCFIAAIYGSKQYIPLSPTASANDIEKTLTILKPSVAIVHENDESALEKLAKYDLQIVKVQTDSNFTWLTSEKLTDTTEAKEAGKIYIRTSGSTGDPKLMEISGERMWQSCSAFTQCFSELNHERVFYNCLPMFYMAGLYNLTMIPLSLGASVVVGNAFSAAALLGFWKDIKTYKVDILWLVPTIVRGLLKMARRKPPGSITQQIKFSLLGTAPIDLATKKEFEDVFSIPLLENYALSETLFLTSETTENRQFRSESSVGAVLPFAELKLEKSDQGNKANKILVKTPFLLEGYIQSDGTKVSISHDDWFETGDLGYFNENGCLTLSGRTRDIIKRGGLMIALREIECAIEEHPTIREAICVPIKHAAYGEDYVLLIDANDPLETYKTWIHNRLDLQKRPSYIFIEDDFPRTPSGKVKKHLLTERYQKTLA